MSFDLTAQIYSTEAAFELQEALNDLSETGMTCAVKIHHPGPQAALEWLVPTALVLWAGDKYFGAFLEEAGKDHYQALKRFTAAIFNKTLGRDATVTRSVRTMSGVTKPDTVFSGNLSVVYRSSDGWRARLLFPTDVTATQYEVACQRFAELVANYLAEPATSPLAAEAARALREKAAELPPNFQTPDLWQTVHLLVFWNSGEQTFYVPDPISSARIGKLVAHRIGTET